MLLAAGDSKAEALAKVLEALDPGVPASLLRARAPRDHRRRRRSASRSQPGLGALVGSPDGGRRPRCAELRPRADARARRPPRRRRARARRRPDHEPAGLGSRPHRRLRGPVDQPPPRRPRRCCAPTWPRSTTPSRRRARCAADLAFLCRATLRAYMDDVRERALEGRRAAATASCTSSSLRHELQHTETMLPDHGARRPAAARRRRAGSPSAATAWMARRVAGGPFAIGAPASGFAYDNERPRHASTSRPSRSPAAR